MSKQKINKSAKETVKKKNLKKALKLSIVLVLFFLINLYIILSFMYQEKSFTVYLEHEDKIERNLIIHETKDNKRYNFYLKADILEELSTTSLAWLPENLHTEAEGSHNGNNYIAYTFYAENIGQEPITYNAEIILDDVIRNMDEALRVVVFRNDEKVVYAKKSSETGLPLQYEYDEIYNKRYKLIAAGFSESEINMTGSGSIVTGQYPPSGQQYPYNVNISVYLGD